MNIISKIQLSGENGFRVAILGLSFFAVAMWIVNVYDVYEFRKCDFSINNEEATSKQR